MRCRPSVLIAALVLACTAWTASLRAAEKEKESPAARRAVQQRFHSGKTAERMEAVRQLRTLASLDAARLAVTLGLADDAPEVRRAAYETLLTLSGRQDCCDFLLNTFDKEARTKTGAQMAGPLITVLLASELPEVRQALDQSLEKYSGAPAEFLPVLTRVADELGRQGDAKALASLQRLTEMKCFAASFACRRATVQAIIAIRLPEALQALMTLLATLDGEVRADVVQYLTAVTGQPLGTDSAAWLAWWKEHQQGFGFPKQAAPVAGKEAALPGAPSYYGLSLAAKRLVFVIDASGSMAGPRLAAAKRELTTAIDGLNADVEFSIVVFNSTVFIWQRKLLPATAAVKQSAGLFINRLAAGTMTATYDALDAAFHFDAEAIYLLTDGVPSSGKIRVPEDIVQAITQVNRQRRISLYVIGIDPRPPGGRFDLFLQNLAEQNYGAYRRVDQ